MAEHAYLALVLAGALYLFWSQRLRTDVTAVLVMLSLIVPWPHPTGEWRGVLTYQQAFSGFGSSALIMIAAMFVIGGAIVQTGAAEGFGLPLLQRAANREWLLQLTILALATFASMFINDTTVVLILLPLIMSVCRDRNLPPSRYLMFAAYGSLLGGQWTLIGTRSNVILSDFLRQHADEGINFFSFSALGAPAFVMSVLFLMLVGRHLLPARRPVFASGETKEFLTEVTVSETASIIGQRLSAADTQATPLALIRDGELQPPSQPLRAGDVIVVRGTTKTIGNLWKSPDFIQKDDTLTAEALADVELVTAEAVLPRYSYYVGQRLGDIPFERNYGVTVLGMAHGTQPVASPMSKARLEPGHSLLLMGRARDVERLRHHSGLILLRLRSFASPSKRKASVMLMLVAGLVISSATGVVQPAIAVALAGAGAVLFGCISLKAAYEAIDWPTLVTLGSIISFGIALEQSGVADVIATLMVEHSAGVAPYLVLGILLLIAVLFTQLIENAAVAIIIAPIAFRLATSLGFDPMPALVATGVCVSAGFATPIAHESTIIVMGPGRYHFSDYLQLGAGLALITWLTATFLTPIVWNF